MEQNRQFAKKIFFLYPQSVIQEQLINVLVQAEFEVGIINDHQKLMPLLHRYPQSLVFINIESAVLKPKEWESYTEMIIKAHDRHKALVGIICYNPEKEVAQHYLMEIGVQCGFIGLKLGLPESAKILLKTLDANEARGGRKYVRVKCNKALTSMNIQHNGYFFQGELLDISSAGMSCILPKKFDTGTFLDDVQLKLWGSLLKVRGTIMGTRKLDDDHEVHVVLFDEKLDRETVAKIYIFIQKSIQAEIDAVT